MESRKKLRQISVGPLGTKSNNVVPNSSCACCCEYVATLAATPAPHKQDHKYAEKMYGSEFNTLSVARMLAPKSRRLGYRERVAKACAAKDLRCSGGIRDLDKRQRSPSRRTTYTEPETCCGSLAPQQPEASNCLATGDAPVQPISADNKSCEDGWNTRNAYDPIMAHFTAI